MTRTVQKMLLLIDSGEEKGERICRNKCNTSEVVYFDIYFVFFSIQLTPKVIFFCHVSASKCSKLWALTLTLCRALSQWEVLRHHRMPWSVCTNCPPWSHSCSKPSAGISAQSYHCSLFNHITRHSASLPVHHNALCVRFIFSLLTLVPCVKEAIFSVFISHDNLYVKGGRLW